jgi:Flp pilus assembly protein TadG
MRPRHLERGTAMIEFALIVPVLSLLFMGIVEMGRFAAYAVLAQSAARDAANYGAWNLVTADDTNGMASAMQYNTQYLPSPLSVTYQHVCSVNKVMPPTAAQCPTSLAGPPVNTIYYIKTTITASYAPWITYPGIPSTVTVSGVDYQQVAQQ